ncbi:patched domain-containing protein 3-like isoform X2 [Amphiura filiformis]|uniref:patched domain-containing protein 3-like isoform X2 n=1 Tax=Amphiura filiformis TaxID=82378 RepID=UPI003B214F60
MWAEAYLQEFFYKYYSPALLNIPVKIIVLVITFGLLGVCIWGTVTWEQNFDFRWFLPADGASRAYFDANDKYFPSNGFATAIYLDEVDYYNERDEMDALNQEFMDSVWIQSTSVSSWYESYESWLSTAKAGHPDLNADNWPKNDTVFYDWLDEFLASPQGSRFSANIKFNDDGSSSDRIFSSRITASHILFDNSVEEVSGMDNVRGIANDANFAAGEDAAFGYSEVYLNFESNKVIQNELLRNLGLASACVFIVILILLANILQTLLVFCCVIFTLVDLAGALNFWGITIDTVVAVILILAIGLAVDYSVHIGHTFMIFSGTRNDRTRATLGCMGAAVFNGGFSTFLAFILLAASNSYIFTTFFKIFLLVVIFGLFHGLVFLPVILSLIGPSPYLSAKPAEESGKAPTPRAVTPEPEKEKVVHDAGEPNGEPRITPHFNPAFVNEEGVEMKSQTNGSASHQDGEKC